MMRRAGQWFASAVIGSLWLARTVSGAPVEEPARFFSPALPSPVGLASVGSLTGRVTGPDGTVIVRAPVVVRGAVRRRVITTADGRFAVGGLPPGRYDVDVDGWVVTPRRTVTVVAGRSVSTAVTAQRLPAVSAAGVGLPLVPAGTAASASDGPPSDAPATSAADDDALAWRLRHARRSVLKTARSGPQSASAPERWSPGLPDTEVHLLSVGGAALPDGLEPTAAGTGGLATVRLRAPLDGGLDWSVALAMTQALRPTWSGSAAASLPVGRGHQVGASVAWMALRPSGPVRMPWEHGPETASRAAGRVTVSDDVHLGPRVAVQLSEAVLRMDGDVTALRSDPTVMLAVVPADGWQVMGRLSQRSYSILDLTTAARWDALGLNAPDASQAWTSGAPAVEQGRAQEFRLERGFGPLRMAVGRVHEQVADGWARVYGVLGDDGVTPTRIVGTGTRETSATQLTVDASAGGRVRGALRIAVGEDRASAPGATARAAGLWPSGVSTWQDMQALLATDVAGARTQVVLVYRVRLQQAADGRSEADATRVARYAVRVRQPLPFLPTTGTQWDVLMDVSTLATGTASVDQSAADEWHVVRVPRRVLGGLALRF